MPPGRGSSVAAWPIQRTALAGSVKNSKTVSGLASMRMSHSTTWLVPASTLPPLLGFRLALELLQAERPKALEELPQLLQSLGAGAVEAPCPFAALGQEAGLLQ